MVSVVKFSDGGKHIYTYDASGRKPETSRTSL